MFPVDMEVVFRTIGGGEGITVMDLGPLLDRLRTENADPTIHLPFSSPSSSPLLSHLTPLSANTTAAEAIVRFSSTSSSSTKAHPEVHTCLSFPKLGSSLSTSRFPRRLVHPRLAPLQRPSSISAGISAARCLPFPTWTEPPHACSLFPGEGDWR
jgi:hypothetical protein